MMSSKTRRVLCGVVAVFAIGDGSCATMTVSPVDLAPATSEVSDPPVKAGAPTLLVAMPSSRDFIEVRRSLVSEVQRDFNITTLLITPDTKVSDLAAAVERSKPVCTVLMNNGTLNLYQQYQTMHAEGPVPPAVVVMAAFVEETKAKLKRATGIAYEVPGVTAFVHLRTVVNTPINRVGVVYRPAFERFIERQKKLAANEHVEIIGVPIAGDVTIDSMRRALRQVSQGDKVDAVWMLNDNGLLRDGQFVDQTWKVELAESKLPLIVGVANLVDPESRFGTLAVVPDLEGLGLQTANMIFDLAENGWKVEDHPVELPLSVKTIVDVRSVRASFGLRPDALSHIDLPRE